MLRAMNQDVPKVFSNRKETHCGNPDLNAVRRIICGALNPSVECLSAP
jgi:hypothetical protein